MYYHTPILTQLVHSLLKKKNHFDNYLWSSVKYILLLHDNAPVHNCKVVQGVIRLSGFIELNQLAYSPDIAPADYYLFSNLKKFLRDKNFNSDDEVITAIEDYLTDVDSDFFCKGIESLRDRWPRVVASEGQYIQETR